MNDYGEEEQIEKSRCPKESAKSNYSPMSLTLIPDKILECILEGLVNKHSEKEPITKNQHGLSSRKGQIRLTSFLFFPTRSSG